MTTNESAHSICIIDDDLIYQFTAKRIIELVNPNQKVSIFQNGKEAIDFFEKDAANTTLLPDIIFLDINMPVMNGWEFLEAFVKLRSAIQKPITIYMVSSSIDEKDKARCMSFEGVKDFIVKPLDQKRMLEILQALNAIKLPGSAHSFSTSVLHNYWILGQLNTNYKSY